MAQLLFGDVAHLLRRSGFSAPRERIESLRTLSWAEAVEQVLDVSAAPSATSGLPELRSSRKSWDKYTDMHHFWSNRAATSPTPIVEKMTLFWHGTLPTSLDKVFHHQQLMDQNTLFRHRGLGPLIDLYQEMSIQPAMLRYLDNADNVASAPNENFARELMELFLLGLGHYDEQDVRTAALAWSGHILTSNDEHYVFDSTKHHHQPTTFMGVTKVWNGPEIIDHLINGPKQTQVSRFLSTKLWSFFAYPNPEPEVVDTISAAMRSGGMRVDVTLRAIFSHPQFRSVKARQGLVRSPFEFLIASMAHTGTPAEVAHPEWYGRNMGQGLFHPPNVSGWRQNRYWISTTAAWQKYHYANRLRWKLIEAGHLDDTKELSPEAAARRALDLFGIHEPSSASLGSLTQFVTAERSAKGWGERAGLLMLPMLTPDFGMA